MPRCRQRFWKILSLTSLLNVLIVVPVAVEPIPFFAVGFAADVLFVPHGLEVARAPGALP